MSTAMLRFDGHRRPAVFLDRDGTIIVEKGFLSDPAGVEPLPGATDAVRMLNEAGFAVIVVSNQSGVARGYFDEEAVRRVNERMLALFRAAGAEIDAVYYCPHYPDGAVSEYAIVCNCRKPKPGLVERAKRELGVEPVCVVGDRWSDIELAENIGVPGILVLTGYGSQQDESVRRRAAFVAKDLREAATWITKNLT